MGVSAQYQYFIAVFNFNRELKKQRRERKLARQKARLLLKISFEDNTIIGLTGTQMIQRVVDF
jgi:hypothetical protein